MPPRASSRGVVAMDDGGGEAEVDRKALAVPFGDEQSAALDESTQRSGARRDPYPGGCRPSRRTPMLGVSAVFFHGIAGPTIGRPLSSVCVGPLTCGYTTTSNLSSAFGLRSVWSEMYVYGTPI